MRSLRLAVTALLGILACAGRKPAESTHEPSASVADVSAARGLIPAYVQSLNDPLLCQELCRGPHPIHVVLPLESLRPPLIYGGDHAAAAQAIVAELAALRSELFRCTGGKARQFGLSREHGQLRIAYPKRTPPVLASCLDELLQGAVTVDIPQAIWVDLARHIELETFPPLTKEKIRPVIWSHIEDMQTCLDMHDTGSPPAEGPLRYPVLFELNADGDVQCIEALNRAPELSGFTCCFLPRMASWRFPATGEVWRIEYPFVIQSVIQSAEERAEHGSTRRAR